ncbi:TetR/AcrR family transcriptional regulator [Planosporangium mesophilum]|uniref:TetR family transcriptional regulator n=1 Tax=Planosporangium mesophilum TaxID=689768 RepID=A0A8J3TAS1_9ACTN|nr:TetR/AcrR family transcriptional regulator [Planosporangium mesophilum]NJC84098.1 TetR/AcrR family transcriptional regulator [Planosporangium mesophilum]GII22899.1 TetR family transcriptional regulator [Planosporangium mesophilum]
MFATVNAARPGSPAWWRARYQRRLRARGRGLTIERICEAALAVLDSEGLPELTMRRLADELGTGPASLYRHVTSREELLVEVADRVLGELTEPDEALGWRDAVEHLAHDLRRVLLTHQAVVLVIARSPLLGPNAMRIRELFWRAMDSDGCDARFAVQTYFTVVHFVVCSALFTAGTAHHRAAGEPTGLSTLLDVLPARQYPTVLRFSEYGDKPDPDYDFDFGLRALLDGLDRSR